MASARELLGLPPARSAREVLGLAAPVARKDFDPESADQVLGPPPLHELERRFSELQYKGTDYEIGRLLDLRAEDVAKQPWMTRAERFGVQMGEGASNLASSVLEGSKSAAKLWALGRTDIVNRSLAEGATRGTAQFGERLVDLVAPTLEEEGLVENEDRSTRKMTPDEIRERDIRNFRIERDRLVEEGKLARGERTLIPGIGKLDMSIVEPASAFDPTMLLVGPTGAAPKAATIGRTLVARTLAKAGGMAERKGEALLELTRSLGGRAKQAAEAVAGEGTEEAATLAPKIARAAQAGLNVADTALPGVGLANKIVNAIPEALQGTGQALSAAGRNLERPSFSEQFGLLGNIARDKDAPRWLRSTARFGRALDPAISTGGRGLAGATEAGFGAGLITGLMGGDPDEIAQSMGGAVFLGGGLGMASHLAPGRRRAALQNDLSRWRSGMSPDIVALLDQSLPGIDQQARVMNTQRFIAGLGDVDFEYLTPAQWKEQGLGGSRALQTVTGDRPVVKVNLGKVGDGSPVFHESGHVLRALFPEQFREIDRMLFSDFTVPEGKGTDFSTGTREVARGILSPEQQQRLYDQYFSKLDSTLQDERRATWDRTQHLESLRDEITAEFLSSLLKDSPSDFLLKLGRGHRWLKDRLILSGRRALLDKLPFLNRIGTQGGPSGSTLFSLDGKPLKVDARTAAQLRQVLRMRDRATNELKVVDQTGPDDLKGATGVVRPAEMMGKEAKAIANIYGNSDTYAKDLAGNVLLNPDGSPVLLDEGAVRKLSERRMDVVTKALRDVSAGPADIIIVNGRTLEPMTLQENGKSWRGNFFTDAQLAAIEQKVGRDLVTPRQLADIRAANEAIKSGQGKRKALDYNPATREKGQKGRRAYASMGNKAYETVPLGFFINKEGGMGFEAFDVGAMYRKLGRWAKDKQIKPQLAMWGGDPRAVEADIFKYIENQRQGRPNSVHLDTDPVLAVRKQRFITDLLGGERAKDALGGTILSKPRGADNSWKSYRIDRLNQMRDSGSKDLPIQYKKVKENQMPMDLPVDADNRADLRRVAPPGESPNVGALTPQVLKGKLNPGPIIVQRGRQDIHKGGELGRGWGWEHVHRSHGEEISKAGYSSTWEFIRSAVNDYDEAWLRPGNVIELITRLGPKRRAIVWLRPGWNDFTVITAHLASGESKGRGELLWKKGLSSSTPGIGPASSIRATGSATPGSAHVGGGSGSGDTATGANVSSEAPESKPLPPGVTPTAVIQHVEAQAQADLGRKLVAGGAPPAMASKLAEDAWKQAQKLARRKSAPHERAYAMRAAERLKSLLPEDYEAIRAATLKGGMKGAAEELERRLLVAALRK